MLKITDLHKRYGSFEVLDGLNMTINTGDIYGFLGKNGCGKTTTMNIVANVIPKDSGHIEFAKEKPVIGYLPETPMMFGYMNAYEYLEYIAACCKYQGNVKERIGEVLELTGMAVEGQRRIKGYSRGMNQRVGIAAAIFNNPDLLILDEPTSALDPQGRAEVMNTVTRLAGTGATIILCTHILSDVERVANRIGIVKNGRMAIEGDINEIKERFRSQNQKLIISVFGVPQDAMPVINSVANGNFLYESRNNFFEVPIPAEDVDGSATAAKYMKVLSDNGITVSKFEVKTKSLEEIYLETIN
ncbi:MAG: ABC transporter ATP-binding protein [Eubacterium sp.]|nr:ABC transporter ATP-binding protein [Eubacterium sp.]